MQIRKIMCKNVRSCNISAPRIGSVGGAELSPCFKLCWSFVRVMAGWTGQQKAANKFWFLWNLYFLSGVMAISWEFWQNLLRIVLTELKHIAGFLPSWLRLPLFLPDRSIQEEWVIKTHAKNVSDNEIQISAWWGNIGDRLQSSWSIHLCPVMVGGTPGVHTVPGDPPRRDLPCWGPRHWGQTAWCPRGCRDATNAPWNLPPQPWGGLGWGVGGLRAARSARTPWIKTKMRKKIQFSSGNKWK